LIGATSTRMVGVQAPSAMSPQAAKNNCFMALLHHPE
jgi:hypothetical protein